jgi:hypothetical protein
LKERAALARLVLAVGRGNKVNALGLGQYAHNVEGLLLVVYEEEGEVGEAAVSLLRRYCLQPKPILHRRPTRPSPLSS